MPHDTHINPFLFTLAVLTALFGIFIIPLYLAADNHPVFAAITAITSGLSFSHLMAALDADENER